jgi:hypothetical protein
MIGRSRKHQWKPVRLDASTWKASATVETAATLHLAPSRVAEWLA